MYKHTQIAWVTIISLGAAFLFVSLGGLGAYSIQVMFLAFILLVTLLAFTSLTIIITEDYIKLVFGIGLIRLRIKISEIVSLKIVRNKWWYGFGIHGWWGKGWLLNVSGLNAVELKMKNGMTYRIGTDEPQKLNDSIQTKIIQA